MNRIIFETLKVTSGQTVDSQNLIKNNSKQLSKYSNCSRFHKTGNKNLFHFYSLLRCRQGLVSLYGFRNVFVHKSTFKNKSSFLIENKMFFIVSKYRLIFNIIIKFKIQ